MAVTDGHRRCQVVEGMGEIMSFKGPGQHSPSHVSQTRSALVGCTRFPCGKGSTGRAFILASDTFAVAIEVLAESRRPFTNHVERSLENLLVQEAPNDPASGDPEELRVVVCLRTL